MDIFLYFLVGCLLTAISYMTFPVIRLLAHRGKFERKRAQRIALWNSVVVGVVFLITTTYMYGEIGAWSAGPAFLYYWINCALLANGNTVDDDTGNTGGTKKANNLLKRIKKIILDSAGDNLCVYSEHISRGLKSGQENTDALMGAARKIYNDAVLKDVVSSFSTEFPDVPDSTMRLLRAPSLCGYSSPLDFENHGATGGALCAVLYFTLTQSIADTATCTEIDTQQSLTLKHYHTLMFPSLPFPAPTLRAQATQKSDVDAKILAHEKAYAQIDKFHDYYQRGIITEAEYNKSREMVLQTLNDEGASSNVEKD